MVGQEGYNLTVVTGKVEECANTLRNRTNGSTFQQHVRYIEAIASDNHVSPAL